MCWNHVFECRLGIILSCKLVTKSAFSVRLVSSAARLSRSRSSCEIWHCSWYTSPANNIRWMGWGKGKLGWQSFLVIPSLCVPRHTTLYASNIEWPYFNLLTQYILLGTWSKYLESLRLYIQANPLQYFRRVIKSFKGLSNVHRIIIQHSELTKVFP